MQTVSPNQEPCKPNISPEMLRIAAVDKSGLFASVEVNLFPRWRQAHGISSYSQMVEIVIDSGVTFAFPDGSDRFEAGYYCLALEMVDIAALQDPNRPTFLSMHGIVVEMPTAGGRA